MPTNNVTPSKNDNEVLSHTDWNQHSHAQGGFDSVYPLLNVLQDSSGASHTGNTTETQLAVVTVGTGAVTKGILIIADCNELTQATTSNTDVFRIKVGTAASETTLESRTIGTGTSQATYLGYTLTKWVDASIIDFASRHNNVKITGQLAGGSTGNTVTCNELTVLMF